MSHGADTGVTLMPRSDPRPIHHLIEAPREALDGCLGCCRSTGGVSFQSAVLAPGTCGPLVTCDGCVLTVSPRPAETLKAARPSQLS